MLSKFVLGVRHVASEIQGPRKIQNYAKFPNLSPCKIRGGVDKVSIKSKRTSVIVAEGGSIRFPLSCSILKRQRV